VTQNEAQPVPQTLLARWLFPVAGPPIPDGTVTISGGRILAVGSQSPGGPVQDLGNVAILPGLVNAHLHLDLSHLGEPLGRPGTRLIDWIPQVIDSRRTRPLDEALRSGIRESIGYGTTALGEIALPDWPVALLADAPLDATVFLELIALRPEQIAAALDLAEQHLRAASAGATWHAGLSPHAPYSVHPDLLAAVVSLSAERQIPLAFHLAESRDELELLRSAGGLFRDRLIKLDAWDPTAHRPGTCPLDYLRKLAAAHRTLIIHGNYLDHEEIAYLADHPQRMSVVYCPRTHAHFRHDPYPLQQMLSAGVTVALGTDSRASSPDLSLLAEMRFLARCHPSVDRAEILRLGTLGGARALGRDHQLGTLQPGKNANLTIVALPNHDAVDPHELLFHGGLPVVATWYRGMQIA
jgi:cytosine/adenosine deaminase-related metal-dependent hydrolase